MRVSNLGIKNSYIHQLQKNAANLLKTEMQMATGKRYERTSNNPIAGINSVYYKAKLSELKQYQNNILDSKGYVESSHSHITHGTNMLARIRELAVQSANGVYTKEEREIVALEVEELLKEMISTANANYNDEFLFAGSKVSSKPFLSSETTRSGLPKPLVERVDYLGDRREVVRSIGQKEKVEIGLNGNNLFWGQNNVIVSLKDSRSYLADNDQVIRIDGQEVRIAEGDDLDIIIDKINREVPSATAFKRELPNGNIVFSIESNYPHELFIEDIAGGTIMSDLGIIHEGTEGQNSPNNIHPNTIKRGGMVFDIIIGLRNALLDNNPIDIGGKHLGSIDEALNSMLRHQARISSVQSRMKEAGKNLALDETNTLSQLSKTQDMDIAEASLNFNQLANVHRISLMTAAKIIRPTLMDYL